MENGHFSGHAELYRRSRPHYPAELFQQIAARSPAHQWVWDCGTGNGQAALALCAHFQGVIASDVSRNQLLQIPPQRGLWRVQCRESAPLPTASLQAITVAQALHWFDLESFYAEVQRTLCLGGLFAAWSYNLLRVGGAVDEVILHYYTQVVGPFWPAERKWVEEDYVSLPQPFAGAERWVTSMASDWALVQLIDYLRSWSASQIYQRQHRRDPLSLVEHELAEAWGTEPIRRVTWPIVAHFSRNG